MKTNWKFLLHLWSPHFLCASTYQVFLLKVRLNITKSSENDARFVRPKFGASLQIFAVCNYVWGRWNGHVDAKPCLFKRGWGLRRKFFKENLGRMCSRYKINLFKCISCHISVRESKYFVKLIMVTLPDKLKPIDLS